MDIENNFSNLLKPLSISLKKIDERELIHLKLCEDKVEDFVEKKSSREIFSNSRKNSSHISHACSFPGCSKLFGKQSRLIVHERTHTGERPFKCSYENCNKSYTRKFHLVRHVSVSHSSATQEIKENISCDKCGKKVANVYSLKKHKNRFHAEQKRYRCKECGQHFRKQQHLKTHSFVHTGLKPYKCEFPGCENRYDIPSRLKRHSLSHVEGRYHCTYDNCSANPKTYTELRHHLTEAHPKVCDVCGNVYETFSQLRAHLLTHQTIREVYYCPYTPCERYYCYEKNLHSHIRFKHNKNFQGFECPICSKWLVTRQTLKRHLTTHDLNKPKKKRNSKKPRKMRKDKGVSRTDFVKLLSGYSSDEGSKSQPEVENESPLLCKMDYVESDVDNK